MSITKKVFFNEARLIMFLKPFKVFLIMLKRGKREEISPKRSQKQAIVHSVASRNSNASSCSLFGKLPCYNLASGCIFVVSWLENLQVEQTNALCNDIEGHKIISKCLFCNIFVGVFAFAHNIGRQFGGIATYLCTLLIHWRLKCG